MRAQTFRGTSVEGTAMQSFLMLARQAEGCAKTWLGWKRKPTTPVAWWAPKTGVTFVTWREALRRAPELEQAVCDQQKARVPVVVDKIEYESRMADNRPLFDGEWIQGAQKSWRSESMGLGGRKQVGGCSVKVVVVVQVGRGLADINFVVFGDGGSLERDVAAVKRWARAQDQD